MMPSSTIIVTLREVRTCREHLCRFLRQELLWWQCLTGRMVFEVHFTPRTSGKPDHKGRVAVWHANLYLRRKTVHPSSQNHIALEAYCALTSNLTITASGLIDPKTIRVGHDEYCQLSKRNPNCDVCTRGDMIHSEERFIGATYAPNTESLSGWSVKWCHVKKVFNRSEERRV